MKSFLAFASFCLVMPGFAAGQSGQLRSGATVYIEPMEGYETYLAAAMVKRQVPLVIVTQEDKAEYIIKSAVVHNEPSSPAVVVNNSASITERENGPGLSATADAFNRGAASAQRAQAAKAALGYSNASISIVDAKSTQIVFAYSATKGGTNQFQKTAEDCAKHLNEFIKKSEKKH